MNSEFLVALRQIEREREISPEEIHGIIEDALTKAFQAEARTLQSVRVEFDPETGKISVYQVLETVETVEEPNLEISLEEARSIVAEAELGDLVEKEVPLANFRRIGIQTVKQHITQRVREMERGMHLERYIKKVGEIVTGAVSRITNNGVTATLEKIDGVMPNTERIPGEKYLLGKRIKVLLLSVDQDSKDQQIILSRSHPDFVRQLFHLEVPEIAQNVVQIKKIVREAGYRTKMAVISTQEKVDPVGACVGYKGSRVKNIVNELNGEKIDIIHWDENPAQFIAHALSPAQVVSVETFDDNSAEVIVPDSQLSLAIGKQGQNARLANKLTGWRIDILSETEKERLMSELRAEQLKASPIEELGLSARAEKALKDHGLESVSDITAMTAEQIQAIAGFGEKSYEELTRKLDARNLVLPSEKEDGGEEKASTSGEGAEGAKEEAAEAEQNSENETGEAEEAAGEETSEE